MMALPSPWSGGVSTLSESSRKVLAPALKYYSLRAGQHLDVFQPPPPQRQCFPAPATVT